MSPIVLRQAWADLRGRALHSLLILACLATSSGLLAIALVAGSSAEGSWDELFERTRGAHLTLELDSAKVEPADAARRLATVDGVTEMTDPMPTVRVEMEGVEGLYAGTVLREWPGPGDVPIGKPLLVQGRAPRAEAGEIVLDRNLAAEEGLAMGSTVRVPAGAGTLGLRVVGFSVTAERCPYPNCIPGIAYPAPGTLRSGGVLPPPSPALVTYDVGLRLADPSATDRVLQVARDVLPPGSVARVWEWSAVREWAGFTTGFQTGFILGFSIVAAALAAALIVTNVAADARSDARRIGVLKAVGFTRRQLQAIYVSRYLALALVGGTIGAGAGFLLAGIALGDVTAPFGGLGGPRLEPLLGVAPLATMLLAVACTVVPVRRVARLDAVSAFHSAPDRARRAPVPLPRRPVVLAQALTDIVSRPFRSVTMLLGLVAVTATLMVVVSGNGVAQAFISDPALSPYGAVDLLAADSGFLPEQEVRRTLASDPGVEAVVGELQGVFPIEDASIDSSSDEGDQGLLRFRDGDFAGMGDALVSGRLPVAPDEAVAGYGLARQMHLEPGDRLPVSIFGVERDVLVTGVAHEITWIGRTLTMPFDAARAVDPERRPQTYLVRLASGSDPDRVAERLERASGGNLQATVLDARAAPVLMRQMKNLMARLSVILLTVVAAAIVSSVTLAVHARRRELALLRAVGMTSRQITLSLVAGVAVLAVAAWMLGLPAGAALARFLFDGIGRDVGLGPMYRSGSTTARMLTLPMLVGTAVVAAAIPAWRTRRTTTIDLLRTE